MTFDEFLQQIGPALDLEWRRYRRRSARHRVEARIAELGLTGFAAYLERLARDPAEAHALPDVMRVTVSRFFRERERWDLLATRVLPSLLAGRAVVQPLRAWSVGCCGGEEPYSLAILCLDAFADRPVEILATDIDPPSLERARVAGYGDGSVREIPQRLLQRWFTRREGRWEVSRQVRALVRFERSNLLESPPPTDADLVICRYQAFTYYRGERLVEATRRLAAALRPGGAVMIGRKEIVPPAVLECFHPWPQCPGFFRK